MWSGSRPRCTNSGGFRRACLELKVHQHTRAASFCQRPKKFDVRPPASIMIISCMKNPYSWKRSLGFKDMFLQLFFWLYMHPPLPPAHPIPPKLHLIPVLSFLWAPSLKNSWGCAEAGWKYVSQHATFHSEALGYELSCSINQNELHPDLWAHAGR